MAPLPAKWDASISKLEAKTIMKWDEKKGPLKDQEDILKKVKRTLKNLYPILEQKIVGKHFIPEFRPKNMPVFGIPGPDGQPCFIRLYLAVDCAVQVWEDPDNPNALGGWGLYDLKTTATTDYLDKTLPQLVFYDLAFHAMTGKRPVEHELWAPLVNPSIRSVNVTDEHRKMVTNWIVSYCHGVWAGEDSLTKDDSNCYTCPTKNACPKMTLPITKDEQGLSRFYFGDPSGGKLHG